MKLSELKQHLDDVTDVDFMLPDGTSVPQHYHVTEVGMITKNFIDCGGTLRVEKVISLQLWNANDTDHRLKPQKLQKIIALSEKALNLEDLEVEVEYQGETIGKYGLHSNGKEFLLTTKHAICLAAENCGVPQEKQKFSLSDLQTSGCCAPGSAC